MHARERMKLVREVWNKEEWEAWRKVAYPYLNSNAFPYSPNVLAIANERIRALLLPNGGK